MSMIKIHAAALSSRISSFHEFLTRYSKTKKVVYGFVEGKEDPSFYRTFIESQIPNDWEIEIWPAGTRSRVLAIYNSIDWRSFSKKRVCFFIDRDLSDLIPEALPSDINIYVTDGYSIENSISTGNTLRRAFTEVCGYGDVPHEEIDSLCSLFDTEFEKFLKFCLPIMSWILHWRRSALKANLNEILMQDLFEIRTGKVCETPRPRGVADSTEYIHSRCNVALDLSIDINPIKSIFIDDGRYKMITRGKYVLWFLVEFCKSVRNNYTTLFPSCRKNPPMHLALTTNNATIIFGVRSRMPDTLRLFFANTYCAYILRKVA